MKDYNFSYCDVGVKIGLSHLIRNIDWWFLKTGDDRSTCNKW